MTRAFGQGRNEELEFLKESLGHAARRPLTVVATVLAAVLVALSWSGTRTPVYKASATIVLDNGQRGILSELSSLMGVTSAASEVAILRSRAIAESAVRRAEGPDSFADARAVDGPSFSTLVDREQLAPLATLLKRLGLGQAGTDGLLLARAEVREPDAPRRVRVSFPDAASVRISPPGGLPGWPSAADAEEVEFVPGDVVEFRGLALRLDVQGEVAGQSFGVQVLDEDSAVRRLMGKTRVTETARNSGVVRVTVSDSDPDRAAAAANLLAAVYTSGNQERSERVAARTIGFIAEQLDKQMAALTSAEEEVVRLQEENPETVDVDATAQTLIRQVKDLELELVKLALGSASLQDATELLAAGQYEALSRVSADTLDPVTTSYLTQISKLLEDYLRTDRSDSGAAKEVLANRVRDVTTQIEELDLELASLEDTIAALRNDDDSALARIFSDVTSGRSVLVRGDRLTLRYLDSIGELRKEYEELSRKNTPEHPTMKRLAAAITDLRAQVLDQLESRLAGEREHRARLEELEGAHRKMLEGYAGAEKATISDAIEKLRERTVAHVESRLAGIETEERALEGRIAELLSHLSTLPEKERRLADPLRRLEAHKEIVQYLLNSQQEAEITRASTVASAELIDSAVKPNARHAPRNGFALALGGLAGLLLGTAFASMRERRSGGFHSEQAFEDATGLPVITSIPDFGRRGRAHRRGFVPLRDEPDGAAANAYRSLAARLAHAGPAGSELRTVGVTSCGRREGRTSAALNLAQALANQGRTVLLVDADLRQPRLHEFFGEDGEQGLAEVLDGSVAVARCIRPSSNPRLRILPAGRAEGSPADLLAGPGIERLCEHVLPFYDVVVFDLPQTGELADVEVIAHKLDALAFLVRSDGPPRREVEWAVSRLAASGAHLAGAVFSGSGSKRNRAALAPAADAPRKGAWRRAS